MLENTTKKLIRYKVHVLFHWDKHLNIHNSNIKFLTNKEQSSKEIKAMTYTFSPLTTKITSSKQKNHSNRTSKTWSFCI